MNLGFQFSRLLVKHQKYTLKQSENDIRTKFFFACYNQNRTYSDTKNNIILNESSETERKNLQENQHEALKNDLKNPNIVEKTFNESSNPNLIVLRKWSKEEDEKLLKFVSEHGKKWRLSEKHFNYTRTWGSIYSHWVNVLNPKIKKGSWTKTEEDKLLKIVEEHPELLENSSWSKISKLLNNGRTPNSIKARLTSRHEILNGIRESKEDINGLRRGYWTKDEDNSLIIA
ncbi:hypothetical protein BB558_006044, partial [Smittium angustum]